MWGLKQTIRRIPIKQPGFYNNNQTYILLCDPGGQNAKKTKNCDYILSKLGCFSTSNVRVEIWREKNSPIRSMETDLFTYMKTIKIYHSCRHLYHIPMDPMVDIYTTRYLGYIIAITLHQVASHVTPNGPSLMELAEAHRVQWLLRGG